MLVCSGARLYHWIISAQHCANPYCAKLYSSGNASACKTGLIFSGMETPISSFPESQAVNNPLQLEKARSGELWRGQHCRSKTPSP